MKPPVVIATLLYIVILAGIFIYGLAHAATTENYNTVHIDCGSLHGSGNITIWFNDELYHIPIECK